MKEFFQGTNFVKPVSIWFVRNVFTNQLKPVVNFTLITEFFKIYQVEDDNQNSDIPTIIFLTDSYHKLQ